jgi:beta-lactamase superfamily II metal-dependent hydrolase
MFRLEVLPAAHGDAIWIEYGDPRRPRRIVVDGGPAATYETGLYRRLLLLPAQDRRIDLLLVTHIDTDHIDGTIILLQTAEQLGISFGEIWFNGWAQLAKEKQQAEGLKPIQGEFLGALLNFPRYKEHWNTRFEGLPIKVPDEGKPPTFDLPDEAKVTILSPGTRQINRLRARWVSALREFSPGDQEEALRRLQARREYRPPSPIPVFAVPSFGDDRSVANGSSIAFLLEHDEVSCLLAGDAHPRVLAASLKRLIASRGPGHGDRLRLDAFKLSHHGSMGNVNEEVLSTVECPRWIVSTNGAVYHHPDRQTAELVARSCRGVPDFLCNYESATTLSLADSGAKPRWRTCYPGKGVPPGQAGGILVELLSPPAWPRSSKPADGAPRRRAGASRQKRRA